MAATSYESVVSLMHTVNHVVEHGHNSFDLNQEQILSVHEKAAILLEFLETYSGGDNKEVEALEIQISDASHKAEDLIENRVVDYIRDNQSTSVDQTRSNPFCQRLQDAIGAMDLMINKAMEIKGKRELKVQLPKVLILSTSTSTSSSSLHYGKDVMVGFDDVKIRVMDRLFQQQSNRLVIPISGMGGIGKTTLARNVYDTPYIQKHFDICAWITISQTYDIKEILSSLLFDFKVLTKEVSKGMNESQLGERVHKHLFGRRYLIVMDDMWNIDAWEKAQLFFPEDSNGSRIIITTRLTNMTSCLRSSCLEMGFLDEDQSWNLLHKKVFGQQECKLELEEIGKKIARNCKGLPLSIVVTAGLLAKSNMTLEYWEHVAEEVSSIVSQVDDGQCSKILSLSYVNLPVHLKPCFLYMGVLPEDHEISVSGLIRLWVSEGFLKPNRAKSLEEIAEEYLNDLIGRNLIMVHKFGDLGNVKECKIHDLLRDLCIREAKKEKFFCVAISFNSSEALHNHRRILIDRIETQQDVPAFSLLRSITCHSELDISFLGYGRLIRVLNGRSVGSFENIVNLVNLRHFYYVSWKRVDFLFSSISNLLWNIQTLTLMGVYLKEPLEIWKMKQLRYLWFSPTFSLLDPGQEEDSNMKHLHTLGIVKNPTFSEGVVKMISNIRSLGVVYNMFDEGEDHCFNNLQHLHKLESFYIKLDSCRIADLSRKILLPLLCKELSLWGTYIPLEDMKIIGCLPNLQVLRLMSGAIIGEEWNPIEGQFISMKYLEIRECNNLKVWNAESIHFPVLEKLFLFEMRNLKEIPLDIGEITTLRCIELCYCCDSVVRSAIDILDEQENQGNDDIQVQVLVWKNEIEWLENLEARDNLKLCII